MAEDIGDGFRRAEDWNRDAFDVVSLDAVAKKLVGKADNAQWRIVDFGFPILRTDGYPYPPRHLVGDTVESQGRDEADYTLGHALGGFGQAVSTLRGSVRELIKSAAELGDEALPFQSGDGGRSNAGAANFGQAGDAMLV